MYSVKGVKTRVEMKKSLVFKHKSSENDKKGSKGKLQQYVTK